MEKKIRSIYEIGFSEIISWDEENDFPGDMNPIISVDGEDPSFITASITEAYRFIGNIKMTLQMMNTANLSQEK